MDFVQFDPQLPPFVGTNLSCGHRESLVMTKAAGQEVFWEQNHWKSRCSFMYLCHSLQICSCVSTIFDMCNINIKELFIIYIMYYHIDITIRHTISLKQQISF